jgi:hypothetical protein
MDYIAIARTIIQALASLSRIPQNVSVKHFTQFLFGSTSNVVKKLALDRIDGYGSVWFCIKKDKGMEGKPAKDLFTNLLLWG